MLRSRDLFIFAVIIILLALGIGLTLMFGSSSPLFTKLTSFEITPSASTTFSASADTRTVDREGTIARLRKLLSQADISDMPSPSVEEVPTDVQTATTSSTSSDASSPAVLMCPGADDTLLASQNWPLQDTTIIVKNGTRIVVHTSIIENTATNSGTSTASSTQTSPSVSTVLTSLLRMPEYPPVLDAPSCVHGEIVGVTQSGFLIANKDAVSYKGRGPDDLIGYARDGFPIYGVYEGEVDSCGGYTKNGSYRYSIAKERNYILGCFVGLPLLFENKPL